MEPRSTLSAMLRISPLFIFNQFPTSFSFYFKSLSRGNFFFCKPHFNIVIELWMASVCNWIRNLSICGSNVVTSDRSLMLTRSVYVCMSLCLIHFSCLFFRGVVAEWGRGQRPLFCVVLVFSEVIWFWYARGMCCIITKHVM